jgi:hypothetical protein
LINNGRTRGRVRTVAIRQISRNVNRVSRSRATPAPA